jgi:hypothetical protein
MLKSMKNDLKKTALRDQNKPRGDSERASLSGRGGRDKENRAQKKQSRQELEGKLTLEQQKALLKQQHKPAL